MTQVSSIKAELVLNPSHSLVSEWGTFKHGLKNTASFEIGMHHAPCALLSIYPWDPTSWNPHENRAVFDRIVCSNSVIIHGRARASFWRCCFYSAEAEVLRKRVIRTRATSSSSKIGSVETSCRRIACQRCLFQPFSFHYFLLLDTARAKSAA